MLIEGEERVSGARHHGLAGGAQPGVLEVVRKCRAGERLGRERMLFNARTAIERYRTLHPRPRTGRPSPAQIRAHEWVPIEHRVRASRDASRATPMALHHSPATSPFATDASLGAPRSTRLWQPTDLGIALQRGGSGGHRLRAENHAATCVGSKHRTDIWQLNARASRFRRTRLVGAPGS